ncbi:GNAT family N-acetyltransferase [Legionella sp. km772]|uniref:GNAT family N-acetyltransferase n=1 Tax=Legionella sp. km772 TaxID=2498111 RepID=UPI000F8E2B4B|nr:GNAT family N-acetyltransferase [Legionella sp. km772]RUR04294.1 GNAT family N-acetyltransferase [Legionella sp. km772]
MIHSSIRFANESDAEAIGLVHIRSWQKTYEHYIPDTVLSNLSLWDRTQQWKNLIREGVKVLVLETNKQIIGFASVGDYRDADKKNQSGEISAIYLAPEYWRHGLGSKLCLAAMEELSKAGYQEVLLWVMSDNIQARLFYEKLGFQVTSKTKLEEFYEGGALLKELLYKKNLSNKCI